MAPGALCISPHLQGSRVLSALLRPLSCQHSSACHISQLKSIGFFSAFNYRNSTRDHDNSNASSVRSSDNSSIENEGQIATRNKYQNKETHYETRLFMEPQNMRRGGMTQMSSKVLQETESGESQLDKLDKLILKMCEEGDIERDFSLSLKDIVASGYVHSVQLCRKLIEILIKCREVRRARKILEIVLMCGCVLDTKAYDVLINQFCVEGDMDTAIQLLTYMKEQGLLPNLTLYNNVLREFCRRGNLDRVSKFLDQLLQDSLVPDTCTYTILIDAFYKKYGVDEAARVFDLMISKRCVPNAMMYNILIKGLCKERRLDEAIKLINEMPLKGCQPCFNTYNTLFQAFCKAGRWEDAEDLLADMRKAGCAPNAFAYGILVRCLCEAGHFTDAFDILENLVKGYVPDGTGFDPVIAYTSFMGYLCKRERIDEALEMLKRMQNTNYKPNVFTYNMVIRFLCEQHRIDLAVSVLIDMFGEGCQPNETTYITVIRGIDADGITDQAMKLYSELTARGAITFQSFENITSKYTKQKL